MFPWAGLNAVHPWLLAGAAAVAAPIIIHLLSKRKFRILDWAAMDFLLEAERKNRRRVRLENLLILLLRCLAIALIAALAARPFYQPQSAAQAAGEGAGFERVFLLDDSASMQALGDERQLVFDAAKNSLATFIEELSQSNPGDRITVLTTSNPETPLYNARFMRSTTGDASEDGAAEMSATIKSLEPTDRVADLDKSLLAVEKLLRADAGQINRIVYVISDFRSRDWKAKNGGDAERGAAQLIKKRLAPHALSIQLCDVGSDKDDNLIVSNIRVLDDAEQPNTWVVGVPATIVVTVKNAGRQTVEDVDVELSAGDAGSQRATIEEIKAGEEQPATFKVNLTPDGDAEARGTNLLVRASIDTSTKRPDVLRLDNDRLLAGRVSLGVRVLIVDGDQGEDVRDSERYFLNMVLAPAGLQTRFKVDWKPDTDLEDGINFDQYDWIFLCNLYRVPEEQIVNLDKWVRGGGGLVFALGNRVDEQYYNDKLFQDGAGLMTVKLAGRQGDEQEQSWAALSIDGRDHPMWKYLAPSTDAQPELGAKVFQWWRTELPKENADKSTVVMARITDPDVAGGSPAIVEKSLGLGRAMTIAIPLDADWSDWPEDLSYAIAMHNLGSWMARKPRDDGALAVGQPIEMRLDAQRYRRDVKIGFIPPPSVEAPAADAAAASGKPAVKDVKTEQATPDETGRTLDVKFVDTTATGYYEVALSRLDGEVTRTLYAANVDPSEGDLARVDRAQLQTQLGDAATIVVGGPAFGNGSEGAKRDYSFHVLFAILGVLGVEQFLAWWFGKKRG
ncbi:MAG: BatA domain-containing protein [Pirellulales bacterium]